MIKQTYIINKEIFEITIKGKKVFYKDRKLPQPIQMIPVDPRVQRSILTSRNRIDKRITKQFKLTKKEQEEYDGAIASGSDFELRLAEICKKDALKEKARLLKEER
jgi:hypothetical protein